MTEDNVDTNKVFFVIYRKGGKKRTGNIVNGHIGKRKNIYQAK